MDFYPRSPCGERRWGVRKAVGSLMDFYPRSPCGERLLNGRFRTVNNAFLSTLSLRRATQNWQKPHGQKTFLSTLSLRRATFDTLSALAPEEFLSTLSLRRATYLINTYHRIFGISIHALLAESDTALLIQPTRKPDFYPRSPCGERRVSFA